MLESGLSFGPYVQARLPLHFRAKREHLQPFEESQGPNLASTVLFVPYSLDSKRLNNMLESGLSFGPFVQASLPLLLLLHYSQS